MVGLLNRTEVKCLIVHPVLKLQKGPYKISVGPLSVIYDPALESQTTLQTD
jgi:hypothetical protein